MEMFLNLLFKIYAVTTVLHYHDGQHKKTCAGDAESLNLAL